VKITFGQIYIAKIANLLFMPVQRVAAGHTGTRVDERYEIV
jgi:hypothetical protein